MGKIWLSYIVYTTGGHFGSLIMELAYWMVSMNITFYSTYPTTLCTFTIVNVVVNVVIVNGFDRGFQGQDLGNKLRRQLVQQYGLTYNDTNHFKFSS